MTEICGLVLMIGIEIVADKTTKRPFDQKPKVMQRLHEKALANGLYIRVSDIGGGPGDRAAFCPPLVITTEEVDKMIGILQPIVASLHQTS